MTSILAVCQKIYFHTTSSNYSRHILYDQNILKFFLLLINFQPPEELQKSFSLQDIEPLNCICSYINNTELLITQCPYKRQFPKIIKRKQYKLKKYSRYIFRTSKLAFKYVISSITLDKKEDLKRYRSALIILELALKTFYLSPLPKFLSPKYFNLCCGKSNTFKNYYTYCEKIDLYQRKPYNEVERIQHIGITFNNDVAWYITEFKLNHYIKLTEKFLNK